MRSGTREPSQDGRSPRAEGRHPGSAQGWLVTSTDRGSPRRACLSHFPQAPSPPQTKWPSQHQRKANFRGAEILAQARKLLWAWKVWRLGARPEAVSQSILQDEGHPRWANPSETMRLSLTIAPRQTDIQTRPEAKRHRHSRQNGFIKSGRASFSRKAFFMCDGSQSIFGQTSNLTSAISGSCSSFALASMAKCGAIIQQGDRWRPYPAV